MDEAYSFNGNVYAKGGSASNAAYVGSPGTVFIQSDIGTSTHARLLVSGSNFEGLNSCSYPLTLKEDGDEYYFHIIDLRERACLELSAVSEKMSCFSPQFVYWCNRVKFRVVTVSIILHYLALPKILYTWVVFVTSSTLGL